VRTAVANGAADAVGESVYKMDLINEALAFTIENIQVGGLLWCRGLVLCRCVGLGLLTRGA
jgi:hypothetical protein